MNLVKGVASLLGRTSSGQSRESTSSSSGQSFSPPGPRIRFSESGPEDILQALWERYDKAIDKVERKKFFLVFLRQFLETYNNWEPVNLGILSECPSAAIESSKYSDDVVIGCSAGHPTEIICTLIEEIRQLTAQVTDDLMGHSTSITITSEGLVVLDAAKILTRSMHNCKILGYYGGIQKLTALMKGAVVQLKTISSALSGDESVSDLVSEKVRLLQEILFDVVSIVCSFINLNSIVELKSQMNTSSIDFSVERDDALVSECESSSTTRAPFCEMKLQWQQKAVVSVMEAGGLNWLVELLRVMRRLSMKEQLTDISLQYLTLRTLHLALADNTRGQSHFKSIGGLDVLLDGLAILSYNLPNLKNISSTDNKRDGHSLHKILQLHVLYLEVLRVTVFGNLNNLQYLCENGRVHKFANSFCSPAFMLQELDQWAKNLSLQDDINTGHATNPLVPSPSGAHLSQLWENYVFKLIRVLCSFVPVPEDIRSHQGPAGKTLITISSVYGGLSIKWFLRVLLMLFPCVKACANKNEFPVHIKIFIKTLQCAALDMIRNILALSPVSLDVLRNEGICDLLFSENFFYSGGTSEELSGEWCNVNEAPQGKYDVYCMHSSRSNGLKASRLELQMKIISFIELAATSSGSSDNLPELSVLLDALEQTSCNSEISGVLAKALLRILQSSAEKTIASLKALNGVARLLKVACIQAKESKSPGDTSPLVVQTFDSHEVVETWVTCMETVMDLLSVYFAIADDARRSVLHSSECVDSLFELFWEESLRDHVMKYIMELMKIVPLSEEDERAKMQLCSKYLEAFNQIKEGHKSITNLSISLLIGMKDMLMADRVHYQALFRDGECFLHIVSLLNGNLNEANSEKLVLHVLHTLTLLLANNDTSKASFRSLVGKGYKTLQNLLLDFCQWNPSEELLNTLLDMLVDGNFDMNMSPIIKNEDVIILYSSVLQKSSDSLRHHGLDVFQKLLKDSLSNRASCARAGMLNFLLDWFSQEDNECIILKIAQLIQVIGGHSISGKDIRKIFAILRSEKIGTDHQYCSLLLTSVLSMLKEKGPTAFFDLNGNNSGIIIKTPLHWPLLKGFSFSCWLRVEDFPISGTMGLFKFVTESGRGCFASLMKDKLIYESFNMKQQCVQLDVNLTTKKWHFLCITHSIGRTFSGGSLFKCYLDDNLVASEKCRYPKINELITDSSVGTKIKWPLFDVDSALQPLRESSAFYGQIGPVYVFNEALSPEQVNGIYSRGPSYMYSFLDNEGADFYDNPLPKGVLASRDSLGSKILFGLSAQASSGRMLFNVSPDLDNALEKSPFEANVMVGTQLCSRRLLQQIIYCVGGVSVFFPLVLHCDKFENDEKGIFKHAPITPIIKEDRTAEIIALIAAVLDENLENQQQMHLLSGFSILGFLLQSVPPQQLNLQTLSALELLFCVVANGNLAELLVKDAISSIFLNPLIWLYTVYEVQRQLYMFLIQQFDKDPRLLSTLCQLPRVIDIISQFYWDSVKSRFCVGSKPLLDPVSQQIIGERPSKEEVRKIRLLLLSLGEMSLRQNITVEDVKALTAFFETSQDTACIEDVLHMVIRAISQKQCLASFLEQVNSIGGCHIFISLLQREFEPVRLLSLQFIGKLLVGLPSEKKGLKIFSLTAGRSKFMSETSKRISLKMQPFFSAISDRLFKFPQTDNLCATLFDVLLGGASPKQVLQNNNQLERQKGNENSSHFFLPEILNLIFRFLAGCRDVSTRSKIILDLLDLLNSNTSNIEALMENGWSAWLKASVQFDVLKNYSIDSLNDRERYEQNFVRGLYSLVLCHYICYIKGGWQQLEETVNFLLMHCEQGNVSYRFLLRDIYDEILQRLINLCSLDNIFVAQPCRDNTLYLLKLVDEMLMSEIDYNLPFPAYCFGFSVDSLELENLNEYSSALSEILQGEPDDQIFRNPQGLEKTVTGEDDNRDDKWWNLYDNLWIIISEINGKGPSKSSGKSSSTGGPSLGQRARGLVESLNIPAAEMAAVVVSGGFTNALGGRQNKTVDKAMLLRGEKCPRIVFRLIILYLCRSSLERASRCVKQVTSLLPTLLSADDEQSKSRLQLFIGALVAVKSKHGMLDDGARFHVISHLLREAVNCGKSVLATGIAGRDESSDLAGNFKEMISVSNLLQKDRVIAAAVEEMKYIKASQSDRSAQLHDLHARVEEMSSTEYSGKKALEDEVQGCLKTILSSDESRRAVFQLLYEEQQQIVTEKWMHLYRSLIDERGPWSANPFPNNSIRHWKLDKTEDSWRRRLKLKQNYHFDKKLCRPSSVPTNEVNPTVGISDFVGHIPEQMKQFLLKGVRRITDEGSSEHSEDDSEPSGQTSSIPVDRAEKMDKDTNNQKDTVLERKESSSLLETESNEVLISVQCVLVTPKRKLAGHLAVMKNFLHFFGEFLVEGTGGSTVFKNFQASGDSELLRSDQKRNSFKWPLILQLESEKWSSASKNEVVSGDTDQKKTNNVKRHRRWEIGKVKAVHWTRYLLRYTAIEIFFSDSTAPIFFNFSSQKEAKDVGNLVVATRNEYLFPKGSNRDKSGVISFVDRRVAVEIADTARERWKRRDMSNFEYLMILNTLAGRSYNDLTQYPVFPWVLADYTSDDLDFNRSTTFRDLTKPVGALNPKRFEVFQDRYRSFCDPDIPSFYYGSHYSSMGIMLYYLLRLEPFTSLHRSLQGGKFDHADRLFQSIDSTYRNCLTNTSDVKELIPEFFYMPEFLVNSNSYHLGVKQDGEPLGDVCLPPWAKGSPEEFVRKNREALESEYVSSNLHHWIDLVFGYKQRGKPSEEAANIFYYLTYEGAVDLDTMEDDLQKSAIEDQIANFGQTPIQIFRKKHPRRGPPIPIAHPLYYAPGSINLTSIICSTNNPPEAVLYIHVLESSIVLVNQGLTLSVKMWLTTQLQSGGNFTFSSSQEPFFGIGSDILTPRRIGSSLAENFEVGAQCFTTLQTSSENYLISCGNWENSFQVTSLADGRTVQSIRRHKDVVSCVAVTSDGGVIATGSYDTTVMLWEVVQFRGLEKRAHNSRTEIPRKDYVILETPFHILCGHDDVITCLYVSAELDVVISGSKDGTCVFHTLREGRYVRSLCHPTGCALSKLAVSRHGRIALYSDEDLSLHLYSINGKHLASSESNGRLNSVELSVCGEFLVCAGDQGQIVVRSMNLLEVVGRYSGVGKVITSLTVTAEECFLAGTKDGNLLVYSIENPQHRKANISRNFKSRSSATD